MRAGLLVLLGVATLACAPTTPDVGPIPYERAAHEADVAEWRSWRHGELTKPDGWLSLAGMYWIDGGSYRFGASPDAELRYQRAGIPALLGTFEVDGLTASFRAADGVEITSDDGVVSEAEVYPLREDSHDGLQLRWGSMVFYVIERSDRLAIRLKDTANPVFQNFESVENFPLAAAWRVSGHFEAYEPARTIKVPTILGTVSDEESEGAAVFTVDGQTYRIDLWRDSDDPENFFTAFGDLTNNDTTYGAGRFVWIDAPDEHGRVVIDFNRSYNPPCAFTPYATCPLPPPQNRLELTIDAGEKNFRAY